jgi:osmotically-inducible protein OsmY
MTGPANTGGTEGDAAAAADRSGRYLVAKIRDALAKDPRVNEPELEVSISVDKVMVSGTVPTDARRQAVTDVVQELAPGMDVRNATEVGPAMGSPRVEAIE